LFNKYQSKLNKNFWLNDRITNSGNKKHSAFEAGLNVYPMA